MPTWKELKRFCEKDSWSFIKAQIIIIIENIWIKVY